MAYDRNRSDRNDRSGGYGRNKKPRKGCIKGVSFDYKSADALRRYLNEYGRIRPRRQTRLCAKEQRALAIEVKKARHLAMLPFVDE